MQKYVPSLVGATRAEQFLQTFEIDRDLPNHANASDYLAIQVGTRNYYARKENKLAKTAIQSLQASRVISQATNDEIKDMIERKKKGQGIPDTAPERLKKVFAYSAEVLQAYLDGVIKEPTFYEDLLDSLIVVSN
jgi:hypothetical protein